MTNDTMLVMLKEEKNEAWVFGVEVEGAKYTVTVPKEYWQKLTRGVMSSEELVRKSFAFLLAREPKESILREFELPVIQSYFPEYEIEMQK